MLGYDDLYSMGFYCNLHSTLFFLFYKKKKSIEERRTARSFKGKTGRIINDVKKQRKIILQKKKSKPMMNDILIFA
jgi:hypothetical protein